MLQIMSNEYSGWVSILYIYEVSKPATVKGNENMMTLYTSERKDLLMGWIFTMFIVHISIPFLPINNDDKDKRQRKFL